MGIFARDKLPDVSDDSGRDIFHIENYSINDLILTITYLILGLVENCTLKLHTESVLRSRSVKPRFTDHDKQVALEKRERSSEKLTNIEVIRDKWSSISGIVISDIAKFYELVNMVTDRDQGASLRLFTQARRDAFLSLKFATKSSKIKNVRQCSHSGSDDKARKRAYAMMNRTEWVDDDDADENDDGTNGSTDEDIDDMMMSV